jgi:hypothetical protein
VPGVLAEARTVKGVRKQRLLDGFDRQKGRCIWCGIGMRLMCGDANRKFALHPATFDHFYNRMSSLRRKHGNLGYAACHKCNSARGTFDNLLAKRGVDISDIWERPSVQRLFD